MGHFSPDGPGARAGQGIMWAFLCLRFCLSLRAVSVGAPLSTRGASVGSCVRKLIDSMPACSNPISGPCASPVSPAPDFTFAHTRSRSITRTRTSLLPFFRIFESRSGGSCSYGVLDECSIRLAYSLVSPLSSHSHTHVPSLFC